MAQEIVDTAIGTWGNALALRLTRSVAREFGVSEGTQVKVIVEPGRLVIVKAAPRLSLEERLAKFDKKRHGGETMALPPAGREIA